MPHTTEGTFPNDAVFSRLLELCRARDGIIIDDPTIGVQATYRQLVADVEQMRLRLIEMLKKGDESVQLIVDRNYHVGYVGHANYEYAVAAFAILALGGVAIPLPLTIDEEHYAAVMEKCDLKCILVARNFEHQAVAFQKCTSSRIDLLSVVFSTSLSSQASFEMDESIHIPDGRPAWVCWTSGSTGVPKGVVHNRRLFMDNPMAFDEVTIAHRPAFYMAGTLALILSIYIGRHVSVARMNAGPEVLCERIRQGGITSMTATVAFYEAVARYFRSHLDGSPERDEYLRGMSSIKKAVIGGSMPVPSLLKYWRDVLGCPLNIVWGSTEGGGLLTLADPKTSIDVERCIGKPLDPTHIIKLSEGDHGIVLMKRDLTFKGYLGNKPPYNEVVNKEGFLITGDIAHRVGEHFIFDGRASNDFIKAVGGPVPIVYMENAISKLPYIEEVYVLPVTDKDVGSRVGVLARCSGCELTLSRLREDLAEIVPAFMLPTALRVMRADEEIERVHSEKLARIPTVEKFFGGNSSAELWNLAF